MTQEEFNRDVNDAMTDLMVDNQLELYKAVKQERYEDAAKLRDKMIYIIEESLKVFVTISHLNKDELRLYFTGLASNMLEQIEENDKKRKK